VIAVNQTHELRRSRGSRQCMHNSADQLSLIISPPVTHGVGGRSRVFAARTHKLPRRPASEWYRATVICRRRRAGAHLPGHRPTAPDWATLITRAIALNNSRAPRERREPRHLEYSRRRKIISSDDATVYVVISLKLTADSRL